MWRRAAFRVPTVGTRHGLFASCYARSTSSYRVESCESGYWIKLLSGGRSSYLKLVCEIYLIVPSMRMPDLVTTLAPWAEGGASASGFGLNGWINRMSREATSHSHQDRSAFFLPLVPVCLYLSRLVRVAVTPRISSYLTVYLFVSFLIPT